MKVAHAHLDGAILDITSTSCPNCQIHLYVSCEGGLGYEVELKNNILHTISKQAKECKMLDYITHKTWVYPNKVICSCEHVCKCISVNVPEQVIFISLMDNGDIFLTDQTGNQYKLDIREKVIDMAANYIMDCNKQSRVVLICRDLSFFHVYTDIWRFISSLCCVCYEF